MPRVQPSRSQVTASEHSRTEAKPPRNARWGCRDQVPSTTTWAGSPATGVSPQHRVSQDAGAAFPHRQALCVRVPWSDVALPAQGEDQGRPRRASPGSECEAPWWPRLSLIKQNPSCSPEHRLCFLKVEFSGQLAHTSFSWEAWEPLIGNVPLLFRGGKMG